MHRAALVLLAASLSHPLLAGCSVAMALIGHREPDFEVVQIGASRADVDREFHSFTLLDRNPRGEVLISYEYVMGDEPDVLRALMNAVLDIVTVFYWEFIAYDLERAQVTRHRLDVAFNSDSRVAAIGRNAHLWIARRESEPAVAEATEESGAP